MTGYRAISSDGPHLVNYGCRTERARAGGWWNPRSRAWEPDQETKATLKWEAWDKIFPAGSHIFPFLPIFAGFCGHFLSGGCPPTGKISMSGAKPSHLVPFLVFRRIRFCRPGAVAVENNAWRVMWIANISTNIKDYPGSWQGTSVINFPNAIAKWIRH